jgi:predicted RND superfamily exporter protein
MQTLMIIGIVLVLVAILIFLYSAVIVGSRADKQVEKYYKKQKSRIQCKDCKNIYHCEHTYLGGCTNGQEWSEDEEN